MAAPNRVEASAALSPRTTEAVALLSAVADPIRWALLAHLDESGETCVCRLQEVVNVAPNLLSYHLRVLRENGLVSTRRRGRWVDYSLAADAPDRLGVALPTSRTVVS